MRVEQETRQQETSQLFFCQVSESALHPSPLAMRWAIKKISQAVRSAGVAKHSSNALCHGRSGKRRIWYKQMKPVKG